jgi:hypothetical protein
VGTVATIASELNSEGKAVLLIDSPVAATDNVDTTISASCVLPSGSQLWSEQNSTINWLKRPDGAKPPALEPSSPSTTAGQPITVTVTARDWQGFTVHLVGVMFYVQGPKSLNVTTVDPPSTRIAGSTKAPDSLGLSYGPIKTDLDGKASIIIQSDQVATAVVSAQFWFSSELVTLPDTTLTWTKAVPPPPPSVTSISLSPATQIVKAGRYAQLSAALTPGIEGVRVDFTATPVASPLAPGHWFPHPPRSPSPRQNWQP